MESGGSLIMTLVTWILLMAIFWIVTIPVTRRKGKSVVLTIVLSLIPIVGFLYIYWVFSLTDKKVLQRLDELEKKLPQA